VVVLPGMGDDIGELEQRGVARVIRQAAPDADVMLTGPIFALDLNGRLAQHLHEDVVLPARAQGYEHIWVVAASLGARGALLYERRYPGEVSGMVLLAPLLDDADLRREITDAGGLAAWQPGPPEPANRDNAQRQIWRMARDWRAQPEQARRIWVVCGEDDALFPSAELLAQGLPPSHFLARAGGHKWTVWKPAAREIIARAVTTDLASR
jgi:pimeloyl-ACP methyl ester carboxylesterase